MQHAYRLPLFLMSVAQLTLTGSLSAADCNNNGIDDAIELAECPPIDVVFVMDTSGSMDRKIQQLCQAIRDGIDDPILAGLTVNVEVLGIIGDPGCDPPFTGNVVALYGTAAPGLPEMLGDCGSVFEDWGPATAIIAANKTWTPGPRIIVPMSDEGPRCGDPVNDPGTTAVR